MAFNKSKWVGRKFVCKKTGATLALTDKNVAPKAFLKFGECAIDLGDGYYLRSVGAFEEITEKNVNTDTNNQLMK